MPIDSRIVTSLNSWGTNHKSLVHIISNDFVYIAVLLAGVWLVVETVKSRRMGSARPRRCANTTRAWPRPTVARSRPAR